MISLRSITAWRPANLFPTNGIATQNEPFLITEVVTVELYTVTLRMNCSTCRASSYQDWSNIIWTEWIGYSTRQLHAAITQRQSHQIHDIAYCYQIKRNGQDWGKVSDGNSGNGSTEKVIQSSRLGHPYTVALTRYKSNRFQSQRAPAVIPYSHKLTELLLAWLVQCAVCQQLYWLYWFALKLGSWLVHLHIRPYRAREHSSQRRHLYTWFSSKLQDTKVHFRFSLILTLLILVFLV